MITARLDEDQLDRLERQLQIDLAHLAPGTFRDTREIAGEPDAVEVPAIRDLEQAAADLLSASRNGVTVAPQAESRPLAPLYEARGVELPPEIRIDIDQLNYAYYVVELTFSAMLPEDQQPLRAEFSVRLDDDVADPGRRLRAAQLFPDRTDVELFRVDLEGGVGLDAEMKIAIPQAAAELLPFAKIDGDAKAKARIVVGPFSFPFRKAKIEVTGISDQDIVWRYNMESALWGTNVFKSILVLKIAKEARTAELGAALSLVPYKRRWAVFKDRLPELKATSRSVIELVHETPEAADVEPVSPEPTETPTPPTP